MNAADELLIIRIQPGAVPLSCEWVRLGAGAESGRGNCLLTDLPPHCSRISVVLPAADVVAVSRALPAAARRHSAALLAFAVEDVTASDPEGNEVSWLGTDVNGMDVLAVVDKGALLRWRTALAAVGIMDFELCWETMLLPRQDGVWSMAWDGREGFVRTSVAEGCATDSGDQVTVPLSLQLLLNAARIKGAAPSAINLYLTSAAAAPDQGAWSRALGVAVQHAGAWHWDRISTDAGPMLRQPRRRWQQLDGLVPRLRPALWMLGLAAVLQGVMTGVAWASLAAEKQALQDGMESRFRELFPQAVAVVDPALQMRRQLAAARQAAGTSDSGDLLPLVELVALATRELPSGILRTLSYERGRLTLEFAGVGAADAALLLKLLRQSGLDAEPAPVAAGGSILTITVRPT